MKSENQVHGSANQADSKAEWSAPRLSEYGNFEKLTLGAGPGKADLGEGDFGHHGGPDGGS